MPRERRVPEAFLRQTFRYLETAGLLPVILGHLEDLRDITDERIRTKNTHELFTGDAKQMAEINRDQGALAELERILRDFKYLAEPESVGPTRADAMDVRPATVRVRKRRPGRS